MSKPSRSQDYPYFRKPQPSGAEHESNSRRWAISPFGHGLPPLPPPPRPSVEQGPPKSKRRLEMTERLRKMRGLMAKDNLDYYIVPSDDAHGSEQVAASDRRLEFISGFTGPDGQAIIMKEYAYLFAGPDYWLQAETEIDELEWTLIRCGFPGAPQDWIEWLGDRVVANSPSRIGIDCRMVSYEKASLLLTKVKRKDPNSKLVHPTANLVDIIWTQKPGKSLEPVYVQVAAYRHASRKLSQLREWIRYQRPDIPSDRKIQVPTPSQTHVATLINSLDCIAYLLNLRGSDIPYNDTFHGYLFVSLDEAFLFIEPKKLTVETLRYLKSIGVQQRNYTDIWTFIRRREWGEGKVLLSSRTSYLIAVMLTHFRYNIAPSYVEHMVEQDGMGTADHDGLRRVYPQDGMSFRNFVDWLVERLADGFRISGYESLAGAPEIRDEDGVHGKRIKVYAERRSDWSSQRRENTSNLPSSNTLRYLRTEDKKVTISHSRSQTATVINNDIHDALSVWPASNFSRLSSITRKTRDTLRRSSTSTIDALDLASISRYSHASSRTVSTDYGLFYTRRAFSEERLDSLIE